MDVRTRLPRAKSGASGHSDDLINSRLLASKLFSYAICHGDECRLPIGTVAKRLQKFTGDKSYDTKKALEFAKSSRDKFLIKNVDGKQFVEAKTSVKICDSFQEGMCKSAGCKELHICRFFLEENCKFGDECKKPHGFSIPQTRGLLVHHKLDNLSADALKILFRKVLNEKKIKHASSTGPSVCKFYNKGGCKNGDKCEFLHVCEHYIDGSCKFGEQRCKRFHTFETSQVRKVLAAHSLGGLRSENQIRSVLQSNRAPSLDSDSSDDDAVFSFPTNRATYDKVKSKLTSSTSPRPSFTVVDDSVDDKTEICGFNLRGKCSYGSRCHAVHCNLPYQWQYCYRSQWKDFPIDDNREVEIEFCDHQSDEVKVKLPAGLGYLAINFQRMKGEIASGRDVRVLQVRRLSTVSSVLASSGHVFRTTWKWYWQDEHDQWHCYDDGKADVTSEAIEQQFQAVSGERKHKFSAGSQKYTLYFDDVHHLYQQNDKHGTRRDVRRRPGKFLDKKTMEQVLEEFKRNRQRPSCGSDSLKYSIPSTWSPVDPSEEFKFVDLSEVLHHDEYSLAKSQFMATMAGFRVKSIKRVQNPGLWEDYVRQKQKITKKNSDQSPEERWLFHGTNKEIVDPICQQGFDWRLSGSKHGARYGKGSYFAVEASYSHNYTAAGPVQGRCRMFMAKVIVGSYVVGSYDTQRPPAKDSSDPLSPLHDSCVNNVANPTIFVVFERSQAYPYYIIDYTK